VQGPLGMESRLTAPQSNMELTISQYLHDIKDILTAKLVNRMKEGEIKPEFYMLLKIKSTFRNKDNEAIEIWTASLTHRRDEVYVSNYRDVGTC